MSLISKLFFILLLTAGLSASAQTRIHSTTAGGNWGTASTWAGGVIPGAADTAEIIAGSTVTMATVSGNVAGSVEVSGVLGFATGGVSLTVNGNMTIRSGGVFNPFFSSAGKVVTVNGSFINDGTTDLSKNSCVLTMGQGSGATTIGGSGAYTTGIVRTLVIDNANGVTLSAPLSVSFTLNLRNGTFTNGSNLTMNDKSFGNGSAPPNCLIQRSQSAQLAGPYTLGPTAALYISYVQNTAGANPDSAITEGQEIPAGRSFYNLTINNPNGVHITDDLTLRSAAAAITCTSGVIYMASGKTLICNSATNAGTPGNSASYVDGAVALTIATTAGTRTFPIGNGGHNRKVVITGLKASTGTMTLRFVIDTSGSGTAGLGITLPNKRRYKGTLLSGSLGSYTNLSIDRNTDDGLGSSGVIGYCISNSRSYYSLGSGPNTATAVVCPDGPYTAIRYYAVASPVTPSPDTSTAALSIITRSGDKLMEGTKEYRFAGVVNYLLTGMAVGGWHMPDEYEIRDMFETVRQMGGTATRAIMFSIIGGQANANNPSHIMALRTYNDSLFRIFDKVLQLANEYRVRLIVPFIGDADSRGGLNQFAAFRGKTGLDFFTDAQLIADFKDFVSYVVNRTNYYTGVQYKNDPAILAWETGSELRDSLSATAVDDWTTIMAPYIKSVDPNHLLMDGKESSVICTPHCITSTQLNNPYTDIITEHYYIGNYGLLCNQTRDSCAGRKAFVIGEFNHTNISMHQQLLQAVLGNGTSGALLWALTPHDKDGGFYYKGDPTDPGNLEYRWPGFSNVATNEPAKMQQIRDYAYGIRNVIEPSIPVPAAPHMLPNSSLHRILWQGSTGAASYILERTTDTTTTWTTADAAALEDAIPYEGYNDSAAAGSGIWYYRVKAQNASGVSAASNIIGPLPAFSRIRSKTAGGSWSADTSWQGGIVPGIQDTVEIISGSTIAINGNDSAAALDIKGTLGFNTNGVSITVNGNITINTGGVFNPFFSSAGKTVTVHGNFVNNGTTDLSKNTCTLTMGQAAGGTSIGGSGIYTTGVVRTLVIDNSNGVTLSAPLSVSFTLNLLNGTFTNGTNLTMNDKSYGNGSAPPNCIIQRSQCAQLANVYTMDPLAALYISYTRNAAGTSPNAAIAEGYEIPAGRTFYNLTINNPNGVDISDDVTLKSSASAITLTSGVIRLASGKTLFCTSPSNVGVPGSETSYVNGGVALAVGTTAATRTFPVGCEGHNRKVVLSGLQASSGTLMARMGIDSAGGGTAGSGISIPGNRRWGGSVVSGSLGGFTKISIDFKTDDGISSGLVAAAPVLGGTYTSLGTGTNTSTAICSPIGSWTSFSVYALANTSGGSAAARGQAAAGAADMQVGGSAGAPGVTVYPNPPDRGSPLHLTLTGFGNQTVQILLMDGGGRQVAGEKIYVDRDIYQYASKRTSGIGKGVYVVTVRSRTGQASCKVVIP